MGSDNSKESSPSSAASDAPPTKPEDTTQAFQTLIKSGEHRRSGQRCVDSERDGSTRVFGKGDGSTTGSSRSQVKGPELQGENKDVVEEYKLWRDKLAQKHEREARVMRDRYVTGLSAVKAKFDQRTEEPCIADYENAIYTCYRQNPSTSLNCEEKVQSFIQCVMQKASKCYRLGPTHTRKQESCKVEINPIRKTPPIEPAEPVNVADDDNDDV